MKKVVLVVIVAVLVMGLTIPAMAMYPAGKGKGFDDLGYNYRARLFNGLLGNADDNRSSGDGNPDTLNGNAWEQDYIDVGGVECYVPVAGTHLVMKWNKDWDMAVFGPDGERSSGDELPWNTDAWMTNHDTWTDTNGKKHVAFLKVVRVDDGSGNLWGSPLFFGTIKVFK